LIFVIEEILTLAWDFFRTQSELGDCQLQTMKIIIPDEAKAAL